MLTLLSPAKNLNFDPVAQDLTVTQPALMADARRLVKTARTLSPRDLQSLMHINDKLAQLTHQRFKAFKLNQKAPTATLKPAVLAFNGEVYNGLQAKTLSPADLEWAQDHLRILSGLYGILRPLDLIQPYRLEMGSKLRNEAGESLYDFWGDKITKNLNTTLRTQGAKVIVNLASNEYFSVLRKNGLKGRVVTVHFKELRAGVAKSLMVYTKKARGLMARYIIRNRIMDPEHLIGFAEAGYRLNGAMTRDDNLVFTRESERAAA